MLRVGTANLLSGRSLRDGLVRTDDLQAAAAMLDVDVLGLQEVDVRQPRSGRVDQSAVVAEALGASWHRFVPALHGTPDGRRRWAPSQVDDGAEGAGPAYGVALVSRRPVLDVRVLRLGGSPIGLPLPLAGTRRWRMIADEPRVAVGAVVSTETGPVSVVTTHLSFVPLWNLAQLRRVARWARELPAPRILLGDLNLPGTVPARLTGWRQLVTAATFPAPAPRVQLDHVLADGLAPDAVDRVEVVELPVSDHRAVTVTLRLPGETSRPSRAS